MRNRTSLYMGLILILIGGGALYNSLFLEDLFSIENLWPLFIMLPGLYLEIDYFTNFRRRDPSVLIPGGILTLIGLFFLLKEFLPLMNSITSPVIMMIIGLALLQYYAAKPVDRGMLVISITLIVLGLFMIYGRVIGQFPYWFNYNTIRALVILLLGLYLVARTSRKDRKPDSSYRPRESYRPEPNTEKQETSSTENSKK